MHQFKQLRLMLDPPPTCRLNMETQRLRMVGGEMLSCYSISYLSRAERFKYVPSQTG